MGGNTTTLGEILSILKRETKANYYASWGRSLEKQLRSSTKDVTLHTNYGAWEIYLKIDKRSNN